MQAFECAKSQACERYCEALQVQGVTVDIMNDSGCTAPDMFRRDGSAVIFKPEGQDSDLIRAIGGKLAMTLAERGREDPLSEAVHELAAGHQEVLDSRMTLWSAMLDARRNGRDFTDAELDYYQSNIAEAEKRVAEQIQEAGDSNPMILIRARAEADHKTLAEHSLLLDEQMIEVVDRLVANLMDGKPTLLVGDKGIAKTQVEKFVARMYTKGDAPIIISGHGDMMSNELMGQMEQDKETRVFAFKEGKLVHAIREGLPVIIDEVNVGDQSVMMRLQDILLRRPGEQIILQENGKEPITVADGFVVMATANEASSRYQHRSVLDPAFRDRFDVIQLRYPDLKADTNPVEEMSRSLLRLAFAAATDEQGFISKYTPTEDLEALVRLASSTQHLYSIPYSVSTLAQKLDVAKTTQAVTLLADQPAMTDCITPRSLVDTVTRCAAGNKPGINLQSEMVRLVGSLDQAGSTHNRDHAKAILTLMNPKTA